MRMYYAWFIEFATNNATRHGSNLWLWTNVEANLGVRRG